MTAPLDPYFRARGNYHLNFGSIRAPDLRYSDTNLPPNGWGPFGFRNFRNRNQPRYTRFGEITDGTSGTLMVSEQLTPADGDVDHRGDMLNDDWACTYFMTTRPPNTAIPDIMAPNFCTHRPERQLPCNIGAEREKAVRSRHPNGVNVTLCDGSVRFVTNNITLATWEALGSMNGNETLGDF